MKKNLLRLAFLTLPLLGFGQIFQEDWDGNGPGISAWTLIDVDGNTQASAVSDFAGTWVRKDRGGATPNYGGPDGNYAAMSSSWYNPAGTSNDWLISPSFTVSGDSPTLYWSSKAQDADYPDGYKVMLSTTGGNTVADFDVQLFSIGAENSSWTSRVADLTPYLGKTVRIAFVNNSTDQYVLLVDDIKADYTYVEPPMSYCGPLTFVDSFFGFEGDEPITSVNFAGINNVTDSEEYVGTSHEFFLDQKAAVVQGDSYTITLQGNTAGNYTDNFAVFIDWNQNGILNDQGEVYEVTQTLTGSTGTDGQLVTHSITVPADALLGDTRMRIKKNWEDLSDDLLNPCLGADYGQAEDYTVTVGTLAVTETSKTTNIKAYPNPVKDIFNIEAQGKIKTVKVYDVAGKQIFTKDLNETKSQIDFSKFSPGVYVVTTLLENGTSTSTKVIKK